MRTNSKAYYFSAFKNGLSPAVNLDRHSELRHKLTKLGYNKLEGIGMYNGVPELTFLVCNNLGTTEEDIIALSKEYQQDTILIVHGDNQDAELVFNNGAKSRFIMGKFKCIDGEDGNTTEPLNGRDYSFFNNKYYVIEEK